MEVTHGPTGLLGCSKNLAEADVRFLDNFETTYFRNNRTDGFKSVLCFPSCKPPMHRPRAFCGTNIHVNIGANENTPGSAQLILVGHLRVITGKGPILRSASRM